MPFGRAPRATAILRDTPACLPGTVRRRCEVHAGKRRRERDARPAQNRALWQHREPRIVSASGRCRAAAFSADSKAPWGEMSLADQPQNLRHVRMSWEVRAVLPRLTSMRWEDGRGR